MFLREAIMRLTKMIVIMIFTRIKWRSLMKEV